MPAAARQDRVSQDSAFVWPGPQTHSPRSLIGHRRLCGFRLQVHSVMTLAALQSVCALQPRNITGGDRKRWPEGEQTSPRKELLQSRTVHLLTSQTATVTYIWAWEGIGESLPELGYRELMLCPRAVWSWGPLFITKEGCGQMPGQEEKATRFWVAPWGLLGQGGSLWNGLAYS